jgi:ribosome-binding factor A
MANERRIKRLEQLILEVAAETMQREVRDPRMGLVSLTRVQLTSDLTHATVFWSTLEEEGKRRRTEAALESALPLLQRRVAGALTTRVTPHLELRFDPTLERAQRLDEIFHRLAAERGEAPEDEAAGEDEGTEADEAPPAG